ncbi:flagellar biosynthesis protein FlhF [Paenibacillus montanisoli]|uniref:Flagellar biosynthesis protein FlhF n=1 Tax=Paenibacillus montanisoli TaxID=2081970 RepID=A0A328U374_9BACL|nr:flagellar biosynthesis protein FlhF [Paenibacillus montanisoli]RAP76243.1 flagellar biosynthesis protein FlhF [Paenibacillus montanisoli]
MKVKRYVVNALPEALPMIRNELGADAIILNTKEIRIGGFLGMFGKKKTEVIAAVEAGGSTAAKPPARPQTVQAAKRAAHAVTPETIASIASLASSHMAERQSAKRPAAKQSATALLEPEMDVPRLTSSTAYEARTAVKQQPAPESGKQRFNEDELLAEIRDMKQWIVRMSKQQQLQARPEAIQALYDRLLEQEVCQTWADRLIEQVEQKLEAAGLLDQPVAVDQMIVWSTAEQTLLEWLKEFESGVISSDTQVIHFVGPTGVGKTTSIAKLAAEQTLKAGRKVGFITSDTYRIAAVDQLRTYATILNVPLEVVFSPSEVARAFKQLEERELIFMDTAGRNFRNELFVSEVNSLLQTGSKAETFLVLSLTGKFKDMSMVAENFAKYGINRVLYTKQDETNAYGAILNLAMEHGLRPTYIAYGQTVPDDIAPFKAARYVSQLLGEAQ